MRLKLLEMSLIGLYRGLSISYIKTFPTLAIQFWCYETISDFFEAKNNLSTNINTTMSHLNFELNIQNYSLSDLINVFQIKKFNLLNIKNSVSHRYHRFHY